MQGSSIEFSKIPQPQPYVLLLLWLSLQSKNIKKADGRTVPCNAVNILNKYMNFSEPNEVFLAPKSKQISQINKVPLFVKRIINPILALSSM